MSDPRHDLLRGLFDRALALPTTARAAFLDRECGVDEALKRRLLGMLAAAEDDRFLADPTLGGEPVPAPTEDALREGPGTRIGPYKLLQQIGEGGFGVVFLAEQTAPVQRKVALKVVKLGMDTRQVVARFEQERQALAMMDHPNIARVLDAGATATGRPFFVMDLVKGSPIVEYCDQNHLTIDERLELFAQVCHAVQHAHGKGIIHRDLKPSNVLVGTQDGRPHAKVIDFGIAKATSQKLTDKTLFTEHHQVIGTFQYMSPEQAEGSLDIDTRTDVYSLGVLLYELLTGSTPFDKKTLKDAMYGEIQRIIREVEPKKPSTRISESPDTMASLAARRRIEPKRLGTLIRGDLDWIVMKALEKDRTRRYETANGLAMDIGRHLAGEAVVAAPPGAAYRLRKVLRRHRGVVAAIAAVLLALLVGLIGFAWQADVARGERDKAVLATQREAEQRELVKARADELEQVAEFQADMLHQFDPNPAGRRLTEDVLERFTAALATANVPEADRPAQVAAFRDLWMRVDATDVAKALVDQAVLKPAVAAVEARFAAQPLVAAKLRHTLAQLYFELGLFAEALPLEVSALDTRRRLLGDDAPDTMTSINDLARLQGANGKLDEAETLAREVLERRLRVSGADDPDTGTARKNLAVLLVERGRAAEAEPLARETLERRRRVEGPDHPSTIDAVAELGYVLEANGKFVLAEACYREALAKRRVVLGEDHPDTQVVRNNLGLLLQSQDKLAEAEPLLREAIAARRRVLGDDHPDVLVPRNNLGLLLQAEGKFAGAEPTFREVLAIRRRVFGEDHPSTLTSLNNLGYLLMGQERPAEAEPLLRAALATRLRVLPADHPDTLAARNNLGMALRSLGRLDEAGPLLREVHEQLQVVCGPDHPNTRMAQSNVASLLMEQGQFVQAEAMLRDLAAAAPRVFGETHTMTVQTAWALAKALYGQRRFDEVLPVLAPTLSIARQFAATGRVGSISRWLVLSARTRTALAKDDSELAAAGAELNEAFGFLQSKPAGLAEERLDCLRALVELHTAWQAIAPGQGHDAEADRWRALLRDGK
jgi:eukaryotic-like serine/threonine-protein kinase